MKKTATKQGTRRSLGISAFPIIILCFNTGNGYLSFRVW